MKDKFVTVSQNTTVDDGFGFVGQNMQFLCAFGDVSRSCWTAVELVVGDESGDPEDDKRRADDATG